MTSIYVPLPTRVADLLVQLALDEMRHPRQQAAVLIVEGLRSRNLLTEGSGRRPGDCGSVKEESDA
jgi:hypothetical protein